jgi:hypothetical protein
MQYMDLTVNGTVIFQGQISLNLIYVGGQLYQPYEGAFFFYDTQGNTEPDYTGYGTRYLLIYRHADGATASQIPVQAVPSQSLTTILDNQNIAINLYEQVLSTTVPSGAALPVGATQDYINQSLLSPQSSYVEPGYWVNYSV